MFTTTPFFRPREGCEPMPITSIAPSGVISPTSASTLEVPMSSPTMTCLSDFLAIKMCRFPCDRHVAGATFPTDCKTVAVAHIHVGNVRGARSHQLRGRKHEAIESLIQLLPSQPHQHSVIEREVPGSARIQRERGEP